MSLQSIVNARNTYPLSAMRGGSFLSKVGSFFKGANNFLRRTKLLSTVGAVGSAFIPQLRIPTLAARLTGYGVWRPNRTYTRVKKGKGMGRRGCRCRRGRCRCR